MLFAALDTETTGLDVKKHEIIQLGVIEFNLSENGDLAFINKTEYKIKPSNISSASLEALKINGYREDLWVDSIPFKKCFDKLNYIFANSNYLLGQNLIFDLKFIAKEYWRYGLSMPLIPKYIDTKFLGQQLVNEGILKSCSMDNMCKHFDVKYSGRAHTALTDCERTISVWEHLTKYVETKYFTFEEPYDAFKKTNNAR
jgi:DNA polymerase III epsilon subunit-like protein